MKQALNDSILFVVLVVIIVALVITLIVLIIQAICRSVADNYIDKNRRSLFNKTRPLSDKCFEAENKLLNELRTYWAYIDELGLDQEYTCCFLFALEYIVIRVMCHNIFDITFQYITQFVNCVYLHILIMS